MSSSNRSRRRRRLKAAGSLALVLGLALARERLVPAGSTLDIGLTLFGTAVLVAVFASLVVGLRRGRLPW
ncbi:hypothetical protein [Halogeometricum luteum]|uniref:PEP-CTERM protein-sorting domain-containing protein n=1 Tax=Halogeometricum luteum TaxID=2950537 RepID=A0ABU2FZT2_9EURY|nr:hypothetical protein [Halogeometricum sp. S3BR5-2]MDS0294044.1 hypothetical protein [Halogeometricum sp. S3BR5-2]